MLRWTVFRKTVSLLCVCLIGSIAAFAQVKISGRVTDESGKPLVAASVQEVGTSNGVYSDEQGNYSITVKSSAKLLASYVGFQTQTVDVGDVQTINITLKVNQDLSEVVVIGYGTARKKDVTGAINTISSKDFGNNSATTPSQLLAGKATGVQVVNASGTPGSGANIVIRGVGSFTSVSPLYVIDGIQEMPGSLTPSIPRTSKALPS